MCELNRYSALLAIIALVMMAVTSCDPTGYRVSDLDVVFISNISNDPVFSWKIDAVPGGFAQRACQVIVSDDPARVEKGDGNIWDSKKMETTNSIQFRYVGPALECGRQYFTAVRVWDNQKRPSAWSETVRFVVPLVYPGDWQAEWLTYDYDPGAAMPLFRKVFRIPDAAEISYAMFYIAAPGYYEAFLNGEKIGDNVLD
ncbi:MAG: hypothetical protein AMS26_24315, partial [Bacteroides sp. SM23_62]